jgi:hypothetical protein
VPQGVDQQVVDHLVESPRIGVRDQPRGRLEHHLGAWLGAAQGGDEACEPLVDNQRDRAQVEGAALSPGRGEEIVEKASQLAGVAVHAVGELGALLRSQVFLVSSHQGGRCGEHAHR